MNFPYEWVNIYVEDTVDNTVEGIFSDTILYLWASKYILIIFHFYAVCL